MIDGIVAFFKSIATALGILDRTQGLKNTPEMKEREVAKKENQEEDKDAKAIKDRDADSVRDGLS